MAKTFSQHDYEENKAKYELIIHNLQKENLQLANKQLRRYWLFSTVSFLKLSVANLEDSAQDVKVYRTNGKDTIILK